MSKEYNYLEVDAIDLQIVSWILTGDYPSRNQLLGLVLREGLKPGGFQKGLRRERRWRSICQICGVQVPNRAQGLRNLRAVFASEGGITVVAMAATAVLGGPDWVVDLVASLLTRVFINLIRRFHISDELTNDVLGCGVGNFIAPDFVTSLVLGALVVKTKDEVVEYGQSPVRALRNILTFSPSAEREAFEALRASALFRRMFS